MRPGAWLRLPLAAVLVLPPAVAVLGSSCSLVSGVDDFEVGASQCGGRMCPAGKTECSDGVCCSEPCDEPCWTCGTPGSEGTCVPSHRGADADGSCEPACAGAAGCACDGSGGRLCSGDTVWSAAYGAETANLHGIALDRRDDGVLALGAYLSGSMNAGRDQLESEGPEFDAALLLLDRRGGIRWAATLGGAGPEELREVAFGPDGTLLATGKLNPAASYRCPASSDCAATPVAVPSQGDDLFVLKADAESGAYLQHLVLGDAYYDRGEDLAVVGDRIVVAGTTAQNGLGVGSTDGVSNFLVMTLRADDLLVEAASLLMPADGAAQWIQALAVGDDGIVMAGEAAGSFPMGASVVGGEGEYDLLVAKLGFAEAGTHPVRWAVSAGDDAPTQYGEGIAVDAAGHTVVVGRFDGALPFAGADPLQMDPKDPGATFLHDMFVACFDAAGQHLWSRSFGGPFGAIGTRVAIDGRGDIVVVGTVAGEAPPLPAPADPANVSADAVVFKLSSSGELVWARRFGGAGDDGAADVVIGPDDRIYVAGAFRGAVDFGDAVRTAPRGAYAFVMELVP